jgi:hypothetical protein
MRTEIKTKLNFNKGALHQGDIPPLAPGVQQLNLVNLLKYFRIAKSQLEA